MRQFDPVATNEQRQDGRNRPGIYHRSGCFCFLWYDDTPVSMPMVSVMYASLRLRLVLKHPFFVHFITLAMASPVSGLCPVSFSVTEYRVRPSFGKTTQTRVGKGTA